MHFILLQNFCSKHFFPLLIFNEYAQKCTWVLLSSDFKQNWKALKNFSKIAQYKRARGSVVG
jgi:hypothetical protein